MARVEFRGRFGSEELSRFFMRSFGTSCLRRLHSPVTPNCYNFGGWGKKTSSRMGCIAILCFNDWLSMKSGAFVPLGKVID